MADDTSTSNVSAGFIARHSLTRSPLPFSSGSSTLNEETDATQANEDKTDSQVSDTEILHSSNPFFNDPVNPFADQIENLENQLDDVLEGVTKGKANYTRAQCTELRSVFRCFRGLFYSLHLDLATKTGALAEKDSLIDKLLSRQPQCLHDVNVPHTKVSVVPPDSRSRPLLSQPAFTTGPPLPSTPSHPFYAAPPASFAAAAATPVDCTYNKTLRLPTPRNASSHPTCSEPEHVLLFYPASNKATASDIRAIITATVDPSALKLGINSIRVLRNNGLRFSLNSRRDLETLRDRAVELISHAVTVKEPDPRYPLLMVHDVDVSLNDEDIVSKLISQNQLEATTDDITFRASYASDNGKRCLLEVKPAVFHHLISAAKVYLGFHSCRVREHINVRRCFKCQSYTHPVSRCDFRTYCGYCGGRHHQSDCSATTPTCINCSLSNEDYETNYPTSHDVADPNCACYLKAVANYKKRVLY